MSYFDPRREDLIDWTIRLLVVAVAVLVVWGALINPAAAADKPTSKDADPAPQTISLDEVQAAIWSAKGVLMMRWISEDHMDPKVAVARMEGRCGFLEPFNTMAMIHENFKAPTTKYQVASDVSVLVYIACTTPNEKET